MSTINPLGSQTPSFGTESIPTAPQTQGTTPAPATQSFTPIWLVQSGGSQNGFDMLGMRLPKAIGDISAILAEVSLALEESIGENRKNQAMMGLAALAAALTRFDLETLGKKVDNKKAVIEDSEATLTETRNASMPLEMQRNAETALISTLRGEISSLRQQRDNENNTINSLNADIWNLQQQLSNPGLTVPQRVALEAALAGKVQQRNDAIGRLNNINSQLSTKEGQHAAAMERREAVDIQLAEVRIDGLRKQIEDLEAQKARGNLGSDEAQQIDALLESKRNRLSDAESQLNTFRNSPKTDANRDAFSTSNSAALQTDINELAARIEVYKVELEVAKSDLRQASFLAVSVIAQAVATFASSQTNRDNDQGFHDQGIEDAFERIAQNLSEAQKAALGGLRAVVDGSDEVADNPRLQTLALGIVTALSDLVTTLARLQDDLLPPPNLLPTQASRVRLEV